MIAEALSRLGENQTYDVILASSEVPGTDGLATIGLIGRAHLQTTAVVMVTGTDDVKGTRLWRQQRKQSYQSRSSLRRWFGLWRSHPNRNEVTTALTT
jgi:CheY-like chemotaxis protein